jgi:hypothetical protein
MKYLLISLLILIGTLVERKDEFISIEHIGIIDKPIPTIILSKGPIDKKFTNKYIISKSFIIEDKSYRKLKNVVEINKSNIKLENTVEYGSFNIAVHLGDSICLNYYLNRKESIQFFGQLMDTLMLDPNNEELLSELETIKNRISIK